MAESAGLIVEMIDDQIVVTMSGTLFLAAYRKRQGVAALAAHFLQDDRHAPIPRAEFVARSWNSRSPKRESSAGSSDCAHGRFWHLTDLAKRNRQVRL